MAGDDDNHHADGQNQDVAVLHHQVRNVLRGENRALGEHREQGEDRQEGNEDPTLPEALLG